MIKTVQGAVEKLYRLREKSYRYCIIEVDGNTIGAALISDILDSIRYCRSPKGVIRQFIYRGYEYVVENGIEIRALTNEEFLGHYMPTSKKSWKDEIPLENHNRQSCDTESKESIRKENTSRLNQAEQDEHTEIRKGHETEQLSVLDRIKIWLKGDVPYKR